MSETCPSCGEAPVEVIEILDDPADPYRLCAACHHRLLSHSLRPKEWYNLRAIHGCSNDILGEEYYREDDGAALQPAEEVVDAKLFPCPTLQEIRHSPERLLTYILSRDHFHGDVVMEWYIHEDLLSAIQSHPSDVLFPVFSRRLSIITNHEIIRTIFHLIGLTLGPEGAPLVRDNWDRFTLSGGLSGIAFAASKCLPLEEAHKKVTDVLSQMSIEKRLAAKHILRLFKTPLNLDWIEKNAASPVDISWGVFAADSGFDWERARKWLSSGRPLSLIALDALSWCLCSMGKYSLLNPPAPAELISTLKDYQARDNVPRVREKVSELLSHF